MTTSSFVGGSISRAGQGLFSFAICLSLAIGLSGCRKGRQLSGGTDAATDTSGTCGSGPCTSDNDPQNCGTAAIDCTHLANVNPNANGVECHSGACFVPSSACASGFGHCTSRSGDICETSLTDSQNCGACNTKCPASASLCGAGPSGPACSATCPAASKDICGSSCVNLQTDVANCGTCGHNCAALPNVAAGASGVTCQLGVCSVPASACAKGFAHCSPRPDEGCEADLANSPNCGGCGITCPATAPVCSLTSGTAKCALTCGGNTPDVCGTMCVDVSSDAKNCGSCGHDCTALPNVKVGASGVTCQSGVCSVPPAACVSGFAHCSARPDDGCEADLTRPESCGQCGRVCSAPTALCSTTATTPSCSSSCAAPAPNLCGSRCVDFTSDPLNCGACGHDCTSLTNVKVGATGIECRSSVCYVPPSACTTGFAHCSTKPDDGCETNLSTTINCGKCGTACVAPTGLCSTTTGAPACSSSCVAPSPNLCGSRCVDFSSDSANCGSCGHDCSALPNVKSGAPVQCLAGVCSIPPTSCVSGFAHCAGSADLGCETNLSTPATCGSCTNTCVAPTALCSTTTGAPACSSSCVAPAPDLCTTKCVDLQNDPLNCGSCGFNCGSLPNVKAGATVQCKLGVCSIPAASCATGFAHCSGAGNLGCETNLSNPATCGSCTNACVAPTALCSTTTGVPMCSSSCVAPAPDLCTTKCVDLQSDPLNCGSCGFNCSSLPNVNTTAQVKCLNGICSIPSTSCMPNFAHCGGSGNLGCETNLKLPATCGSCTNVCVAPTANCSVSTTTGLPVCSSSCVSPTPDLCGQSCVNRQTDAANCGTCGHNCATLPGVQNGAQGVSCSAGVCVIPPTACQSGRAHCSGSGDLGCETNLTLPATCGSCTNKCSAPTANCSPTSSGTSACSSSCTAPTPNLCGSSCVDLQTSTANCGACNHNCATLPGVVSTASGITCVGGACVIPGSACTPGLAHCAGSTDLGCETSIRTSTNCGMCNIPCTSAPGATANCTTGTCVQTCSQGLGDCTSAAGCESSLNTPQHCGSCGVSCNVASCVIATGMFTPAGTCNGVSCTAGVAQSCSPFACGSSTACANTCTVGTNAGCASGFYCSGGTMCLPKKGASATCGSGAECTSTFCADSVCCDVACNDGCSGCALPGSVGKCTTRFAEFDPLLGSAFESAPITLGPDNALYFLEEGNLGAPSMMGRIVTGNPPTITELSISNVERGGIARGSDGQIWYDDTSDDPHPVINRMTTAGVVSGFVPPNTVAGSNITSAVLFFDGMTWVEEIDATGTVSPAPARIVQLTPSLQVNRIINTTTFLSGDMTRGSDSNLWFIGQGLIAKAITTSTVATLSTFPAAVQPFQSGIASGPDGLIWYSVPSTSRISRINPTTGAAGADILVTAGSSPGRMLAGPLSSVWFLEVGPTPPRLGRATAAGVVTECPFQDSKISAPGEIVLGPDQNVWFTGLTTNNKVKVYRYTP